jgi:hypothetical protein
MDFQRWGELGDGASPMFSFNRKSDGPAEELPANGLDV